MTLCLSAQTYEQLVGKMWKAAFITEATPYEYMQAVSKRLAYQGLEIPTKSALEFISGLQQAGLVSLTSEGEEQHGS